MFWIFYGTVFTMKAKKHLGQNFLKNKSIIDLIVKAGDLTSDDFVLEIGPGMGILTEKLLEKATVLAVEKDLDMMDILKTKFQKEIDSGKLILINDDILEIDLDKHLGDKKYKLIANIPYYITGEIIRKFLENKNKPKKIVLLVQKEVALRIVAENNKESILSLSVKFFGKPRFIKTVKASNFSPQPKVDSAIVEISEITQRENEQKFFDVVKTAFAHKRKLVSSNLSLKYQKSKISLAFQSLSIDPNVRAEDLSLDDFLNLSKSI